MLENPKVTIITPAYNAERFLGYTVESVLRQTYKNWEMLILDDGSTDDTFACAKRFTTVDSRIHAVKNKQNIGVAATRNQGIELADGDYIAFLDSDDVWREDKLERQITLLHASGADIAYSSYSFIDANNTPIGKPYLVPEFTDFKKMLSENVIGLSTAMVKRDILRQRRFNSSFYHEDYVLWMTLLRDAAKAVGDKESLVQYRVMEGTRSANKLNAAKHRWRAYRSALGISFWKSFFAFCGYALGGVKKLTLNSCKYN
ncbi:MAG: glycosyltransferase family 2 protein [Oscillospiraceae bacterium]|nr:glycosyltransferase family 2 protein [Oscillospiraceae bacterium]